MDQSTFDELIECYKILGIDQAQVDEDINRRFFGASMFNQKETVELLLSNGADIETVSHGMTALIAAVICGAKEIVELLLDKGANVEEVNDEGKTALDIAKEKNHLEILNILKNR